MTSFKHERLDFPEPVFILDDFLPEDQAEEILQECIDLAPYYKPAKVHDKNGLAVESPGTRQNDIVYVDNFFAGDGSTAQRRRADSKILTNLECKFFRDDDMRAFWKKGSTIHSVVPLTTYNETILSRYGKCDFYGWHTDGIGQGRIVTAVYYVNRRPEKFKGGEISMRSEGKTINVKPLHNRCVVFPSHLLHRVENVTTESTDPGDWRFSLNCWFGFRA